MALYNASGTASGSSTSTGAVTVTMHLSASFQGSSSGSATAGTHYLSSGSALGSSFAFQQLLEGAGVALGSSTADIASSVVVMNAKGIALGSSTAILNTPLPAQGTSTLTGYAEVLRPGKPVNAKACCCCLKSFNWLQLIQHGDLSLFLSNGDLGGIGALRVTYSFIQVRPDGSRKRVGPQDRIPVQGKVGEYWATGLAGESGQPGNWVIEWKYQVSSGDPIYVVEQGFKVFDAVMRADSRSTLDRKVKFGWN